MTSVDASNPAIIDKGNDGLGKPGVLAALYGKWNTQSVCTDYLRYITIKNIYFTNTEFETDTKPASAGVHLLCAENITLRDSKLTHVNVKIDRSNNNVLEKNLIQDVVNTYGKYHKPDGTFEYRPMSGGDSLYLIGGSSNNLLRLNQIIDGGHSTISMGDGNHLGPKGVGNKVIGNYVSNKYATPIFVAVNMENTHVENNTFTNGATQPSYSLLSYECADMNHLENCKGIAPRAGIELRSNNNTILRNFSYGNTGGGIKISAFVGQNDFTFSASGNKVYHNVFYNNGQYGFYLSKDWTQANKDKGLPEPQIANNIIANNIFYKNKGVSGHLDGGIPKAIYFQTTNISTPWPLSGSLGGNTLQNNLFLRDNGTPGEKSVALVKPGLFTYFTIQELQTAFPAMKNNIEGNPLFMKDPPAASLTDFMLQAASPAIDKGIAVHDVNGTPLPFKGDAPDLGAYEFGGTPITPTPTPTASPSPPPTAPPTQSPSPSPGKTGDINGDGKVDVKDLSVLLVNWLQTGTVADLNKDGTVDVKDLSIILSNWNN